jgi:predicted transcriptional regulator
MRVQDIMARKYACFQADDGLDRILAVLSEKRVSSAPVFIKDELLGVVGYSDLVKYFIPREGRSLPFMASAPAADESKITASFLARKPSLTLTPDQPVSLVMGKIAFSQDCVPVMDGKKVVGVVWPENIVDFFLAERTKTEAVKKKPNLGEKPKAVADDNETTIDRMFEIVKRDGITNPKKVAKELGITETTAEDLGKLLGKHMLVKIDYSFVSGMTMRRIDHGGR